MSRRDLLDEIGTWLLSQLQAGEWAIRVLDDDPLAGSDDTAEWHDVLFCGDTGEGRYRRTVQVDREFIDDAARKGCSSYVIRVMKDQHVIERLLAELDHWVTDPIVLRHVWRG